MNRFIRKVVAFGINTAIYGALIWGLYWKVNGGLSPSAQNILAFGLALFAFVWSALVLLMLLGSNGIMNEAKRFVQEQNPISRLAASVASAMVDGTTREEYAAQVEKREKSIRNLDKHRGDFIGVWAIINATIFVGAFFAVVVLMVMAGYIKTAVYMTIVEFFWFVSFSMGRQACKVIREAIRIVDDKRLKDAALKAAHKTTGTDNDHRIAVEVRRVEA